jgi:hypothetical protein
MINIAQARFLKKKEIHIKTLLIDAIHAPIVGKKTGTSIQYNQLGSVYESQRKRDRIAFMGSSR